VKESACEQREGCLHVGCRVASYLRSSEEVEVDVVQTSENENMDTCGKLEGVLRILEQNAPQELRTN